MFDNIREFENLTPQEMEIAKSILEEMNTKGSSTLYNKLIYEDYEEIPVSIDEFLHNEKYLGKALTDSEGRFTVYPY